MLRLVCWHGAVLGLGSDPEAIEGDALAAPASGFEPLAFAPSVGGVPLEPHAWFDRDSPEPALDPIGEGALAGAAVTRRMAGRWVHFERRGHFLCAQPDRPAVRFTAPAAGPWETFLVLTEVEHDSLRAALAGTLSPILQRRLGLGPARLKAGFILAIGHYRFDLGEGVEIGRLLLQAASGDQPLRSGWGPGLVDQVASVEAFRAGRNRALPLRPAHPQIYAAPLFVDAEDEAAFHNRGWKGHAPHLGEKETAAWIMRRDDQFVSMSRGSEGTIFDRGGAVIKSFGFLRDTRPYPDWVSDRHGAMQPDRQAMAGAEVEPGPCFIFYNGNLQNYYHWMVEAMVALHLLTDLYGAEARLVLPPSVLQFRDVDYPAVLRDLGFDGLKVVQRADDRLIRVEEAIWIIDSDVIESMPAESLHAFRARAWALRGPRPADGRRLFVKRKVAARPMHNLEAVEARLEALGFFSAFLEDLSPGRQIDLFRGADVIVAQHGAGLANLLFCAPGTRVIELMPSAEMRPFFWQISEKLGLVHAMLFCDSATQDKSFNAPMQVDLDRLDRLYRRLVG